MAKKRIHDFPIITPGGDEILIVDDPDGNGGYETKGVLISSISGGGGTAPESFDNTITVSQGTRGDFSSIKAAIDAANANGSGTPQAVLVYPGIYTEAPMVVNSNITVKAVGEATVIASDNNSPLFTLSTGSLLRKLTIQGPTNSSCIAPAAGAFNPVAENCVFSSGDCAGSCDDATASLIITFSRFSPGLTGNSLRVTAGRLSTTGCFDISGQGMFANGGILSISSTRIDNAAIALHSDNGGQILGQSIKVNNADIAISTGPNDPTNNIIDISAVEIFGSTTLDIQQEGVGNQISIGGGFAKQSRIEAVDWSSIRFYFLDTSDKDDSFEVLSNINVGSIEKPSSSAFGQGAAFLQGVKVLVASNTTSTTDGDTFVDYSTTATTNDGSTFTMNSGGINEAIYFGMTRISSDGDSKFWGLQVNTITGINWSDYVDFEFEYWNGSSWIAFKAYSYGVDSSYPYSKEHFARNNSSENINFGLRNSDNWISKSVNGITAHWVRYRRILSSGTTPVIQLVKLHGSYAKINRFGRIGFFGKARPRMTLSSGGNIFGESGAVANSSINIGNTASTPLTQWDHSIKNSELNGNGDAVYYQFSLPKGIDTSLPIFVRWLYTITNPSSNPSTFHTGFLPIEVTGTLVSNTDGSLEPIERSRGLTDRKNDIPAQTSSFTDTLVDLNRINSFRAGPFYVDSYYEGDVAFVRLESNVMFDAAAILALEIEYYTATAGGNG